MSKKVTKKKSTRGRSPQFPKVTSMRGDQNSWLVPAERVKRLYNDAHPKLAQPAKRVSERVRTWFSDESTNHGWSGKVEWHKDVTGLGFGAILRRPKKVTVRRRKTKTTS